MVSRILRGAVARQSDLRFTQHICDGSAQFVCEVGGELRKPCKGIIKSLEHFIESDGQGLKFGGQLAGPTRSSRCVGPIVPVTASFLPTDADRAS